jgi:hypothetical protein
VARKFTEVNLETLDSGSKKGDRKNVTSIAVGRQNIKTNKQVSSNGFVSSSGFQSESTVVVKQQSAVVARPSNLKKPKEEKRYLSSQNLDNQVATKNRPRK